MCGITGWVSFHRDLSAEHPVLDAMTETMACRGPDAAGTWLQPHAAFGHRRLAVIDIKGGVQPMMISTAAGPVGLTYSGEAYNFTELREELRGRGHGFRTHSDTEVVLRGYLEWGEELVDKLMGMYAFAVWDGRAKRLILVRDRLGIKPLYYYPTADGVLFGSEPKAILVNSLARRAVDANGLRELLFWGKTPGHAVWSGMREVRPGAMVIVDRAGLREHTYWRLTALEHTDDLPTTVTRVRDLLEDIVRRQLVADVPRCVLLSGGLDSSTMTAIAAAQLREQGEQVRTFSVDFVGQTGNFTPDSLRVAHDTPFAHDVVQHVGSVHQDIVLEVATLADPEVRRATVTARDLPVALGDMDNSLYLLFKAIREHSTVALSGESADELFGGYQWFHDPRVQQAEIFPWLAGAMDTPVLPGHAPLSMLNPELASTLDVSGYIHDRYADAVAEAPVLVAEDEHETRMRRICFLHLTHFVPVLLDRKDRMSMAVGLEVRVPYCDHRLVEYVFNAPWSMKTFDGREKSLLRAATADLLPRSVIERTKNGYPSTNDPKYLTALQYQVEDRLADATSPLTNLISRQWLEEAARLDPLQIPLYIRNGLELALDLATWLDIHRPQLHLT